jgi:hypothetical protein
MRQRIVLQVLVISMAAFAASASLADDVPARACTGLNCLPDRTKPADVCKGADCDPPTPEEAEQCSGLDCQPIPDQAVPVPEDEKAAPPAQDGTPPKAADKETEPAPR